MDEFDPIPPVSPFFRGLLSALLILTLALVLFSLVAVATGILVWGWQ